ncbi:hypothetical protein DVH24_001721 [Malus domestica]|uniref:Uncharacterized protein n=1 Tax=Malus domestica TaxID=3750 RepID=A0A498IAP3_MALDO|nr:hypothetical protein DVH24_001721 [Malus domestica]
MVGTVSLPFLARSAEEEEEVSHVTRCTSVVLLEARRRHGGRRESDRCVINRKLFMGFLLWIKGEVSPYLIFLENGLSFFSCTKGRCRKKKVHMSKYNFTHILIDS